MGKRLTQEEREARIKAYEEIRNQRRMEREARRAERIKAYEEAKAKREKKKEWEKRGVKAAKVSESKKVSLVQSLPPFKGKLEIGDEVGFRFLGMAMSGKIRKYTSEDDYHDVADMEEGKVPRRGKVEYYSIEDSEGTVYPIKKIDIFCKKINGEWKEKA